MRYKQWVVVWPRGSGVGICVMPRRTRTSRMELDKGTIKELKASKVRFVESEQLIRTHFHQKKIQKTIDVYG